MSLNPNTPRLKRKHVSILIRLFAAGDSISYNELHERVEFSNP
jgi:hypothetical protein